MCIDFLNYYFMMNTSMILEYAFRFKTGKCAFIFLEKHVTLHKLPPCIFNVDRIKFGLSIFLTSHDKN